MHKELAEEDILEELLADERRHHEELEQLEAEMKDLKELQDKQDTQQRESSSTKQKMQPGNRGKLGLGNKSPTGIKNKSVDQLEEELRNKEAQMNEAKRKANEDAEKEMKAKDAEKIAMQREAKFQAEMAKLSDEKKKRALLREKRRDARIVKRILRLSENERHYDVLGLRCKWGTIRLGPLSFCKTTVADVKRAYRNAARWVHPDKNRDGRAGEAFDALDKSAAILMDDKLKRDYDLKLSKRRRDALQKAMSTAVQVWIKGMGLADLLRKILGPFALPIMIIVVLII
jgi:hypothetical protein